MDSSVVEPVDIVERRPFDMLHVAPGSLAVDQLGLVDAVERFGERVVAVALGADRRQLRIILLLRLEMSRNRQH